MGTDINGEMKEKILADLSPYLCRSLGDPSRYIPHLMARHLLDVTDKDAIKAEGTSQRKVKVFVDMLKKKGACAFDGFVEVLLEERVESHIARKLQQALRNEQENALSHTLIPRTSYVIPSRQEQPLTDKKDIYTSYTSSTTSPSYTTRNSSITDKITCPFATPRWNTTILSRQFDHNGGTLVIEEHDITITIPQLAISQGDMVEVQAAAAILAPYQLPTGYDPISVFVWLGGDYVFRKMIKVTVPHCAAGGDGTSQLTVLTGSDSELAVQQLDDCHQYRMGDVECHYYTDQLCSLCVARKRLVYPIRTRLCLLYCVSKDWKTSDQATIELSMCCDLKYYVKRAKKYYKKNKSFESPCLYPWSIVIDYSKQQKFKLSYPTCLTGWDIANLKSTRIDVKDMGFPQSILDVIALQKVESTPFPPRFAVSLTRRSEYDSLSTELKINLENNRTVTNNCVTFPVAIGKLRSRASSVQTSRASSSHGRPVVTHPSSSTSTAVTGKPSTTAHSIVSSYTSTVNSISSTSITNSTSSTSSTNWTSSGGRTKSPRTPSRSSSTSSTSSTRIPNSAGKTSLSSLTSRTSSTSIPGSNGVTSLSSSTSRTSSTSPYNSTSSDGRNNPPSSTNSVSQTSTATTSRNVTTTPVAAAVATAGELVNDNNRRDPMGAVVDNMLSTIATSRTGSINLNVMLVQGTNVAISNHPAHQFEMENKRSSNSLQAYADDITRTVDVDTILSPMMKHGLLTLDQQQQLTSSYTTTTKKQQILCGIVLALSEDHVEKFLQCLSETSDYEPHNTLVNKIKNVK